MRASFHGSYAAATRQLRGYMVADHGTVICQISAINMSNVAHGEDLSILCDDGFYKACFNV